jgi:hypothetical protein
VTQISASSVFISYCHKDRHWLEDLRSMLSPLVRTGVIQVWWDGKIKPSEEWRREIEEALSSAHVAVLLVSRHFLASNFIIEVELRYLLEAAQRRNVKILWLLISPCLYEHTALREIQALNDVTRPLSSLRGASREAALKSACQAIAETTGSKATARQQADRLDNQRREAAENTALLEGSPEEGYSRSLMPTLLIRDDAKETVPWANARNQVYGFSQGCLRIAGAALIIISASMFYFLLACVIALPLSAIDGLKPTVSWGELGDALGWSCVYLPIVYAFFAAAFAHALFVATKVDNLKGAKTFVIELAAISILLGLFAAMTSSNLFEQIPGFLGLLGALLIFLLAERWLARWLEQRG